MILASRGAAFYREDEKMALQRNYYRDRWNEKKVWEVAKLVGGYYLRQYISGQLVGRGMKTSMKFIKSIGVFEFEEVGGIAG